MRTGYLGALGMLLVGAGLASAQSAPRRFPTLGELTKARLLHRPMAARCPTDPATAGKPQDPTAAPIWGPASTATASGMASGGYGSGSGADMSQGGYSPQQGGYGAPGNFGQNQQAYGGSGQQAYNGQAAGGYGQQCTGGFSQQGYVPQSNGGQGGGGYGQQGPGGDANPGAGPGPGGYGQQPGSPYGNGQRPLARPDDPGETGRFWFKGEYLYWWLKPQNVPALITTGSATDPVPGALGQPGTSVLFGDDKLGDEGRSGGRISAGFWLDCDHTLGFDGSFFILGSQNSNFGANFGNGANGLVLARPFFDVVGTATPAGFTGPTPASEIIAFPGQSTGSAGVSTASRLHGTDVNFLCNWLEDSKYRLDFLLGFNFARLEEDIDINESSQVSATLPPNQFGGGIIDRTDSFGTKNNFYGGQIGSRFEYRYKALIMQFSTKTALGVSDETVDIAGNTTLRPLGQPATVIPAGLYGLQSNIGSYNKDRFAVLSELDLTLGWQVKRWCRIYAGYSFLYWSSVVRPADQIDQGVNRFFVPPFTPGTGLVGPVRPSALFKDTDFWAHGVNAGVEFRY